MALEDREVHCALDVSGRSEVVARPEENPCVQGEKRHNRRCDPENAPLPDGEDNARAKSECHADAGQHTRDA